MIDFRTQPDQYKHWKLSYDGPVATLTMDVDENGGLVDGYDLKLNSYDLGVDIELYDITQRMRFEHPEVGCVMMNSGKEKVFCAGANIKMLGTSSHAWKVNFCKFTNETRNGIEDASEFSDQKYLCVINGVAAGGGYELALAADHIMLVDDGASAVSLPEVPLLAVLPGTGGLTRVVDKRHVRRDHADYFCTLTEGIKGKRAAEWKLVDEVVPRSKLEEAAQARALEMAASTNRPVDAKGIELPKIEATYSDTQVTYGTLSAEIDQDARVATITLKAPDQAPTSDVAEIHKLGAAYWPLAFTRDLDNFIIHMRTNQPEIGTWVFKSVGDIDNLMAADQALLDNADDWLVREITHYLKRTIKRIDVSSRSIITLVEPGSCFAGSFFEFVLTADRSFMLDGTMEGSNLPPAAIRLNAMNFGTLPMGNGLSRMETRFLDEPDRIEAAKKSMGDDLDAETAEEMGFITFIPDDIDWEDEVRIAIEERASFSTDALTGMEASLRFAGPETMETKIFGRLSAWQNWIFQRPNAVGDEGALKLYGSGQQPNFNKERV